MEGQTEKHIHKALKEKNTNEVLSLLKNLKNLNCQSNNYRRTTPLLCVAVSEGNIDVVQELLKMGADTNVSGDSGMKPLHLAIKHGRMDIMKILLNGGDTVQSNTDAGDSALFMAVINKQADMVEHLINCGAKLDEPSSFLYSHNMPIHEAAKLDDVTILNLILSTNANVDVLNDERRTALHIAASLGCTNNVERLIQRGASVNLMESSNRTALQLACESNHVQVVRLLCVAGSNLSSDDGHHDPLNVAVSKKYINVVRTLLHFGADVNRVFPGGMTALHLSIGGCRHKMGERWSGPRISVNSEIEMLDTLLQAGADVNFVNGEGSTPLHRCVIHGCDIVLDYLINSGADYNQVDRANNTPLQLACSHNVTPAIQLLIKYCPGLINHVNHINLDSTPLVVLWGKRNLDSLKLLCDAGYQATNAEKDYVEMIPRKDRKKVDTVITHYLEHEFSNPWKLSRICRTLIRKTLEKDLTRKVRYLPIPELMRRSLLLIT